MTDEAPLALLAEDEPQMADLVGFILESEGLRVRIVHDGLLAREVWAAGGVDVAVLDVGLPGLDGVSLCREIRAAGSLPVLMLTARSDDSEVIEGLEAGADDYVVKPFKPRVLALRVNALLRRTSPRATGPLHVGDLRIDPVGTGGHGGRPDRGADRPRVAAAGRARRPAPQRAALGSLHLSHLASRPLGHPVSNVHAPPIVEADVRVRDTRRPSGRLAGLGVAFGVSECSTRGA